MRAISNTLYVRKHRPTVNKAVVLFGNKMQHVMLMNSYLSLATRKNSPLRQTSLVLSTHQPPSSQYRYTVSKGSGTHYGFAPHETRRSNMQISFQKNVQGMRNKMRNCQSFKSRVYINVITIVSALSVRINDLFIEEQCP